MPLKTGTASRLYNDGIVKSGNERLFPEAWYQRFQDWDKKRSYVPFSDTLQLHSDVHHCVIQIKMQN